MVLGNMRTYRIPSEVRLVLFFLSLTSIADVQSDENTEVRECAFLAFLKISKSRQGLHAVERTKIWDHFPEHLSSLSSVIHQITWNILTNLAVHAVDSLAVEGSRFGFSLFALPGSICLTMLFISESDSGTRRRAIQTLSQLSYWPEGAEAAAQAGVLEYFPDLLNSSDVEVRGWTCGFLGNLAFHGSISAVELGIELCTQAISILSDEDSHVRDCAILALSKLHRCPGGMGEVAWHPAILKHFVVHLDSSDARIRRFTCSMLGDLAVFQSAALAMFDFEPCIRLAGMLKDTDDDVQHWAVYALSKLSRWPGAARAIEAEALHHIPALLESSDTDIQTWTCEIVANLAIHTNMPLEEICVRTVSLLRNGGSGVREHALYAIAKFSRSCEGAEMVGGTNIWEFFSELLDSFDPRICQFTCSILGNLAIHDPDSLALLGSPSYVTQAASLLRDEEVEVQRYALYALAKISCCPDAASWVAADALTLESLLVLLSSFDPYTRRWTCETLAHLALHGCITPIELGSKACAQIAVLLSDENKHVRRGAILALSKISRSRDGAEVVGATKILKYATKLLDSNHTRVLACETLGNLACYQALPQLGRVLRKQLTALLSDEDVDIRESAMFALSYGTRETVQ
ncbi:armadillo-type protein [Mycena polygramma]|nr:armadillo-type protein [Mycena polygramma]